MGASVSIAGEKLMKCFDSVLVAEGEATSISESSLHTGLSYNGITRHLQC
jgi:hypothetical protein